ncbi:MAG: hypothetical protein ACOCQO_01800 [Halanaerobiaceae bacterium]
MRKILKLNSIKTKMVISFTGFILIIVGLASFFVYNQARDILQNNVFSAAEDAAIISAKAVNDWLEKEKEELEIIASSSDVQSMDWNQQENYLKELVENSNDINAIFIADMNGNARVTHGTDSNIRDREYFQEVIDTGNPAVSDLIISRADNQHIVVIARPI